MIKGAQHIIHRWPLVTILFQLHVSEHKWEILRTAVCFEEQFIRTSRSQVEAICMWQLALFLVAGRAFFHGAMPSYPRKVRHLSPIWTGCSLLRWFPHTSAPHAWVSLTRQPLTQSCAPSHAFQPSCWTTSSSLFFLETHWLGTGAPRLSLLRRLGATPSPYPVH